MMHGPIPFFDRFVHHSSSGFYIQNRALIPSASPAPHINRVFLIKKRIFTFVVEFGMIETESEGNEMFEFIISFFEDKTILMALSGGMFTAFVAFISYRISKAYLKDSKEVYDNILLNTISANITHVTGAKTSKQELNLTTIYKLKQDTLLELSDKRNTDKLFKKWSFILAVIMSIVGTIILFSGIVLSFFLENKMEWVTIVSGVIVEFMAGIYFVLLNKTMAEVKENSQQLEDTKNQITAIELIENIKDDKTKDAVYQKMIESLMVKK